MRARRIATHTCRQRIKFKSKLDLALASLVACQRKPCALRATGSKLTNRVLHRHLQLAQGIVRADIVVIKNANRQTLALAHAREAESFIFPHWVQIRAHHRAPLRLAVVRSKEQQCIRIAAGLGSKAAFVRRREVAPFQQRHFDAHFAATSRCSDAARAISDSCSSSTTSSIRRIGGLRLAVLLQRFDKLLRHAFDLRYAAALRQLLFEFAACTLALIWHKLLRHL